MGSATHVHSWDSNFTTIVPYLCSIETWATPGNPASAALLYLQCLVCTTVSSNSRLLRQNCEHVYTQLQKIF